MKKRLVRVLTSVFLCAVIGSTGIVATASSDEEVDLIFSWWGNQTRNEMTQEVIELYMEEHTNISIDGQFAEFADYWNKLATASAGHTLPDVVQMDYAYLEQYANNQLLVDLTPYYK